MTEVVCNINNLRECPYCHWWQVKPKNQGDKCENPKCKAWIDRLQFGVDWLIWKK